MPALTKSETRVLAHISARGGYAGSAEQLVGDLRAAGVRTDYAWKALAGLLEKGLLSDAGGRFQPVKRSRSRAA